MFELPPASIFEKILEKDEALADEVFERATKLSEEKAETHYRLTRQDKVSTLMRGALSVFGSSPRPTISARKTHLSGEKILSDSFRQALSEIVEKNDIQLSDDERKALQPVASPMLS